MTKGEALLALASREIGYREGADGRSKYGAWYAALTHTPGMDGAPWCMMFVQWCYERAGMPLPCRTASCGALLRWYREHQPDRVGAEPVPGCIAIFDFPGGAATDHTGLFVSRTGTEITTVDGNTSGTNQSNGGWVQQKTRRLSYARPVYIVPRELTGPDRAGGISGASGTDGMGGIDGMDRRDGMDREDGMTERYDTLDEIRAAQPWAAPTVEKLLRRELLRGTGAGLDLSGDMLRLLVVNDRAGLYGQGPDGAGRGGEGGAER